MKKNLVLFIATLLSVAGALAQEKGRVLPAASTGNRVELKISGMTCAGCAAGVSKVLARTEGVIKQEVEYPGDVAVVTYDPALVSPEDLVAVIEEKTSFRAEVKKKEDKK